MIKNKILLLEDNKLFAETLKDYLEDKEFIIEIAYDGKEALERVYTTNYDIYLLDVNVPFINGIEFLKLIREAQDNRPVIFITSHADKNTLIKGYKNGCDDFIRKPVDLEELYYRIKALLRKSYSSVVHLNKECVYNLEKRELVCNAKVVKIPIKVIKLLELFIENKSKIVTKDQIISSLWSAGDEYSEGSIRVYITKLKKILGKDSIKNIKGLGYKLLCLT